MNADRLSEARVLFDELVELPLPQRGRSLREKCASDPELRGLVERLLQQHDKGLGEFLERPYVDASAEVAAVDEELPSRIGAYEIVRKLGEGGMGIVYEARQENPRRTVALKLIRSGFVSTGLLKRFEHEAQVLGQLQHPGIAQIYEAGTAEVVAAGRGIGATGIRQSFFAMEFVRGKTLTQSANDRELGTRQRLELFAHLCDAVHYAHSRGVIHRDIKPGNILVDETGRPKILDFGVARATNADMQSLTLNTAVGQLIGTIPYMSPEQVSGDPVQIDFRSDVYSLGVTLYELLVGRLPFDLHNRSIPEAARIIREEEPTRLSSIDPKLRGDIETIVAKAIEKEPARRYGSVAEMAADIRRYLNDEPVQARPASTWYQFKKFSRRNRGLVWGVAATLVMLFAGVIVASTLAIFALRQRDVARQRNVEALHQAYRAGIAAAYAALQSGDVRLAQGQLSAAPADLRDWEWQHLNWLINSDSIESAEAVGPECRIAYSDDQRVVATLDSSGRASIWSLPDLQRRQEMQISMGDVRSCALSRDGRLLVAGTLSDGGMGVWDTASGQQLWTIPQATGGAQFSPVENVLAVYDRSAPQILIVDATTGKTRRTIPLQIQGPPTGTGIQFSADGRRLAATNGASHVILDYETGRVLYQYVSWCFALNQSFEKYAAFDSTTETFLLGSFTEGKTLASISWKKGCSNLQWFPHDAGIFLSLIDGSVSVLDAQLREVHSFLADRNYSAALLLKDPLQCVRILANGHLQYQRTSTERTAFSLHHPMRFVGSSAAIARDGRSAFIGDWGYVRAYDAQAGTLKWCTLLKRRFTSAVSATLDGRTVVAADRTNDLWRLNSNDGAVIGPALSFKDRVLCLAGLGGDNLVAAGLSSGEIALIDDRWSQESIRRIKAHQGPVRCIEVSSDGTALATGVGSVTGDDSGNPPFRSPGPPTVKVWNARVDACIAEYPVTSDVEVLTFNSDARLLAVATADRQVSIFNVAGRSRESAIRMQGNCRAMAFNPSGTRLVTFAEDGVIRVWDVARAGEVLNMQSDRVSAARFTPDGDSLVAAGPGAAVVSFDTKGRSTQAEDRLVNLWAHQCLWEHRHELISTLTPRIRDDPDIPDAVRKAAIHIAELLGDHVGWLVSDGIISMQTIETHPEALRRALELTNRAAELLPADANIAQMHAEALFEHREFDRSATELNRLFELLSAQNQTPSAEAMAMLALSNYRIGKSALAENELLEAEALAVKESPGQSARRSYLESARREIRRSSQSP
ncbi:MAG TPA: serine/threonine-protein kinase [Phycisphaerae bacterium]|nr:serine/threonine-protein kinase [Phycisphaerae bacterium]